MNIGKPVSLNLNVRGLRPSATLEINALSRQLRESGRKIYRLGLGQSPFPVPDSVVAALRENAGQKDYLDVRGLGLLREAVAGFHRLRNGVDAHADSVLVGPGSKELLFLLQLTFYGDILVPTPCWVSYTPQARILGRRVRLLPTTFESRWRLSPDELFSVLESDHDTYRPRLLVLNYPSNPHGLTYTEDELARLAEVARRFDVLLLSDEIYGELHFDGEHHSVARYHPEGTIISSGLSKWCGAGGWRLGTFTFPPSLEWLRESMAAVASETYTSVSAPIQYAAVTAFRFGEEIQDYLFHARRILDSLAELCCRELHAAEVRAHMAEGGFYLFLDFEDHREALAARGIRTARALCSTLLAETGVAILPGEEFERLPQELTARLAFVDFDGAAAHRASQAHGRAPLPPDFADVHCTPTVEAVRALCAWLGAVRTGGAPTHA